MNPRRLKGHKAAATCCVSSNPNPGIIASASEDGSICFFDLRCKDDAVIATNVTNNEAAISSLCFKSGNENVVFAASCNRIFSFDVCMASSTWKPLDAYNFNTDEINQISFSPNSYFLAAADDSGEVKIIDTRQNCLYKTLRAVHTSICSTVQFIPWKPWSAITGGLDCKLAMWDFSKGRAQKVVDYGTSQVNGEGSSNPIGQWFNPTFIHSVAVPDMDSQSKLRKVCAVAKGDAVVDVIELESKPLTKSNHGKKYPTTIEDGKKIQLDYTLGGHTAAVSCVSFSKFGEKGKYLISGGNDASVKIWDWAKYFDNAEANETKERVLEINVKRKINWLCTTPNDSDNLVVCDTSKVLKVYTVP